MRFTRLLFLPLDGAIVAPPRWRRGGHEIPRSALQPIADAIETGIGLVAGMIQREADGHDIRDAGIVTALGARLWPIAAEALPEDPPDTWASSGLAAEDYAELREVIRPVLAAGVAIQAACQAPGGHPSPALLRAALVGPAAAGARPLGAAVATLLLRAGVPGMVLRAAAEFGDSGRSLARSMTDLAIAVLPDPANAGLASAATAASRFFAATADLAASGVLDAERTRRLTAQRHAMEQTCRRLVEEAGRSQLVDTLSALRGADAVGDPALAAIERDARAVRALAQVARAAGDPAPQDRALRQIARAVGSISVGATEDGLSIVDLARVVEILDGPDAATALLSGTAPR